jgi:hypothetical protein
MMAATALTLLATAPQPLAPVELFLKKAQKTDITHIGGDQYAQRRLSRYSGKNP